MFLKIPAHTYIQAHWCTYLLYFVLSSCTFSFNLSDADWYTKIRITSMIIIIHWYTRIHICFGWICLESSTLFSEPSSYFFLIIPIFYIWFWFFLLYINYINFALNKSSLFCNWSYFIALNLTFSNGSCFAFV